MPQQWFNVFAGCETGLLKGIQAEESTWKNICNASTTGRENQIVDMCWSANNGQTQIVLGRRNNIIETRNCDSGGLLNSHVFSSNTGKLRSIHSSYSGIITATESGCVRLWDQESEKVCEIEAGSDLYRMRGKPGDESIILTGGKENFLKLWDMNKPDAPVFIAKNVRNDWLNLRVPVWVTDAQFVPGSSQVVTCTGHKHIRMYDPSSSRRRPVVDISHGENPLTAIGVCPFNTSQVVVGDSHGSLALFDLRRSALVHVYKGAAGSIRSLQVHPTLPLIVSAGLDRFVRVHQLNTRQQLHKVYVKSAVNSVLVRDDWLIPTGSVVNDAEEAEQTVEDDALWKGMSVIGTDAKRKRKLSVKSGDVKPRTVIKKTKASHSTKTVKV